MNLYIPPLSELDQIPKPARVKGDRWGYCGIAAISAAIGISPLIIHKSIPDWPGYTPSRMIKDILKNFGYSCVREIVPKLFQRTWPQFPIHKPSWTALGRIYFGEGKWADSHWVCFKWCPQNPDDDLPLHYAGLYDNAFRLEEWFDTHHLEFYSNPAALKSLYWIIKE